MIGTTVGNHIIVEKLGDGGMGSVFRAVDEMLDREVAIKVLRPELTRQPDLIDRFRAEAIAMARVSHPNIAVLHGLEKHGENLYMIMEYVRGETLEHLVTRNGRLPWRQAAEILTSVLEALDHAHQMGVVHRDIKPANIMLTGNGVVKVMDFGIARVTGMRRQTALGNTVGTPSYMAPEQLRGEDVDGRADLYAVGAAFFELLTGRMAFEADSDYRIMLMHLNDPPPAPSSVNGEIPASIDNIVLRAMQKRALERFPDAATFRSALRAALNEGAVLGAAAHAPPPVTTRPLPSDANPTLGSAPSSARRAPSLPEGARAHRRRPWRVAGIATGLFVTGGLLALVFQPRREPETKMVQTAAPPNAAASTPTPQPPDTTAKVAVATPVENQSAESALERPRRAPLEARRNFAARRSADTSPGNALLIAELAAFTRAVNGGSLAEVERLLRGPDGPRSRFLGLVREGRVTMNPQPVGTPDIRGDEASVPFVARLSWRTPHGSVRRTAMPLQAELARRGGTWQLNFVQIRTAADLR